VTRKLWMAHLVKDSPRYREWLHILGSDEVPITNPRPMAAQLGPELTEVYKLDLDRFERNQMQRLTDFVMQRFQQPLREVRGTLESEGFPIRACDVTVSYELRAFL
jgi:hypothetical protein